MDGTASLMSSRHKHYLMISCPRVYSKQAQLGLAGAAISESNLEQSYYIIAWEYYGNDFDTHVSRFLNNNKHGVILNHLLIFHSQQMFSYFPSSFRITKPSNHCGEDATNSLTKLFQSYIWHPACSDRTAL